MKIESYKIAMEGKHSLTETYYKKEEFRFWSTAEQINSSNQLDLQDILELSKEGLEAVSLLLSNKVTKDDNKVDMDNYQSKIQIRILEKMLEVLTGKKFELISKDFEELLNECTKCKDLPVMELLSGSRLGWGMEYNLQESHLEVESTSFLAKGIIKTSDGREILFDMNIKMDRAFMMENNISIRAGDALVDPLVINFDKPWVELIDDKISFDLNLTGKPQEISFLKSGSGFLMLDRNGNGKVDDGAELFGPSTGNGFLELARYDEDKNGWIDSNDAVFERLMVWAKDKEGKDLLLNLEDLGIGAIYLGSVATPFSLKDGVNNLLGQTAHTGIFVNQNGTVGTIQHIDLAI